jgi:hypothetical protein
MRYPGTLYRNMNYSMGHLGMTKGLSKIPLSSSTDTRAELAVVLDWLRGLT